MHYFQVQKQSELRLTLLSLRLAFFFLGSAMSDEQLTLSIVRQNACNIDASVP